MANKVIGMQDSTCWIQTDVQTNCNNLTDKDISVMCPSPRPSPPQSAGERVPGGRVRGSVSGFVVF
jgi:hypothetical protein